MSDALSEAKSFVKSVRVALAVSGAIALIVGLLLLIWPGKTAAVVTAILATYLIIGGLVYIALGIFSKEKGGWSRVGYIVLGLLFIIGGVVAFANLAVATAWIAVFIGVIVGIAWIIDGIVSLSLLGDASSKPWTIVYSIISILGGVVAIIVPFTAATILWLILGIALVILGVVQIVRAITLGKDAKEIEQTLASDV